MMTSWVGPYVGTAPGVPLSLKGELCSCDIPAWVRAKENKVGTKALIYEAENKTFLFFFSLLFINLFTMMDSWFHAAEFSFS